MYRKVTAKMIYVVDIDNTICTDTAGNYSTAQPHYGRINKINALYDAGHTIIYWTARGMKSGLNHTELTNSQLRAWGCKFHEIRMGKPHYDVWIDDKAIRAEDFFA